MTDAEPVEFVYVMGSPGSQTVKIGRSTDPGRRLAQIQTMSPIPLTLLATHAGGHAEETYLHRRFSHLRTHGEWFKFDTDPLVAVSEGLAAHREELARRNVDEAGTARNPDILAKVAAATEEFQQTRRELEEAIRDARDAGVPLTLISKHSGFSREWARKIANGQSARWSA